MSKRFYRVMIRRTRQDDLMEWEIWPWLSYAARSATDLLEEVAVEAVVMSVKDDKAHEVRRYRATPRRCWKPVPFYRVMMRLTVDSDYVSLGNLLDVNEALDMAVFALWNEDLYDVTVSLIDSNGRQDVIAGGYAKRSAKEGLTRVHFSLAGTDCTRSDFWLPASLPARRSRAATAAASSHAMVA